jgi:hypothetical protein
MPKRHPASGEDEDTTEEQDAQVLHTLANYLEIKSMHEKRTKTKIAVYDDKNIDRLKWNA